jgi:DNA polymerase III subunit epsilon
MAGQLARWRERLAGGPAPDAERWVVLDVEASGLDPKRDRLLAVAAVALRPAGARPLVDLGDSFELVLRQPGVPGEAADKPNILLHGIGLGAQRAGTDPATALQAFAAWVGRAPLLAFHASFDRTMIERACHRHLGRALPNPWLDLADLAPVLYPEVKAHALDDWLAHFGIPCAVRHQAAADTLATAELLQKLWPRLRRQLPQPAFRAVARLAAQRRWLGG